MNRSTAGRDWGNRPDDARPASALRPSMVITAAYSPAAVPGPRRYRHLLMALALLTIALAAAAVVWPAPNPRVSAVVARMSGGRLPIAGPTATAVVAAQTAAPAVATRAPDRAPSRGRASEDSAAVSAAGYSWPATGIVTQEFGCTDFYLEPWHSELGCRFHHGIDIADETGTPIYAARAGRVLTAGWLDDGYGYRVVIADDEGKELLYAHLCCQPPVTTGDRVAKGEQIGSMGSTGASSGSHLHFAVIVGGMARDPRGYLPAGDPRQ